MTWGIAHQGESGEKQLAALVIVLLSFDRYSNVVKRDRRSHMPLKIPPALYKFIGVSYSAMRPALRTQILQHNSQTVNV